MSELHRKIVKETHFLTTNNPILEYLVKYYIGSYVPALKEAYYLQALPLPSEPRMEVAMQAISHSEKSISAVRILKEETLTFSHFRRRSWRRICFYGKPGDWRDRSGCSRRKSPAGSLEPACPPGQ